MEHKKAKWSGDASGLNEKTLSLLFDYQRFEHEPELEALLDEAENEYCAELSDDDLAQVSAAGEAKRCTQRIPKRSGATCSARSQTGTTRRTLSATFS